MQTPLPQPKLEPVPNDPKGQWVLCEDYQLDHKHRRFLIRRGFRTDGESIPRWAWIFTGHPFQPRGMPAAIIHDALYGSELLPREQADRIFKELLERNGVNAFRAMCRYRFLRMFGGITYSTHTEATRAAARKFIQITNL